MLTYSVFGNGLPLLGALGMVAAVVKPIARILAGNPVDGLLQRLVQRLSNACLGGS